MSCNSMIWWIYSLDSWPGTVVVSITVQFSISENRNINADQPAIYSCKCLDIDHRMSLFDFDNYFCTWVELPTSHHSDMWSLLQPRYTLCRCRSLSLPHRNWFSHNQHSQQQEGFYSKPQLSRKQPKISFEKTTSEGTTCVKTLWTSGVFSYQPATHLGSSNNPAGNIKALRLIGTLLIVCVPHDVVCLQSTNQVNFCQSSPFSQWMEQLGGRCHAVLSEGTERQYFELFSVIWCFGDSIGGKFCQISQRTNRSVFKFWRRILKLQIRASFAHKLHWIWNKIASPSPPLSSSRDHCTPTWGQCHPLGHWQPFPMVWEGLWTQLKQPIPFIWAFRKECNRNGNWTIQRNFLFHFNRSLPLFSDVMLFPNTLILLKEISPSKTPCLKTLILFLAKFNVTSCCMFPNTLSSIFARLLPHRFNSWTESKEANTWLSNIEILLYSRER